MTVLNEILLHFVQEMFQYLEVSHFTLTRAPSHVSPLVDLLPLSLGPETPPLSPKNPDCAE